MSLQNPEDRLLEKLQQLHIGDPSSHMVSPLTLLRLKKAQEAAQEALLQPAGPMSSLANMVKTATVGVFLGDMEFTLLGVGNFGCVHLARNVLLNQQFAIKVMNKRDIVRGKQIEHVFNEKNVLLLVKGQPFVTQLHATFMDNRNLYLCMDFCPGGDLFRLIRDHGSLDHSVAAFYGAEVLLCFEFLHAQNIAFRDLKPENVLIAADGHIKLCDFGFAKEVKDRTWTLCGTPEYLAPEVLLGEGHTKAVDWWSFGVLLFEMMAGYPPFPGTKPMDIYDKILEGNFELPPFFTSPSKDIVRRLLTRSPAMRLGNLVGGTADVKNHNYFSQIDFDKLSRKEIDPPIVPTLKGEDDLAYIDFVDDGKKDLKKFDLVESGRPTGDPYGSFFKGWDAGPS